MTSPTTDGDPVVGFYRSDVDYVFDRTLTEARIEGEVLRKVLADRMPTGPCDVADIGGGNGRWAFELAAAGHAVRLCDVTPALVQDAVERAADGAADLVDAVVAGAEDLPWPSGCADVALMLGPMYCLHERSRRMAALAEARRVLRPGGTLLVQCFNRIAGLRSLLFWAARRSAGIDWRGYLETGVFADPGVPEFHRAVHYWHTPEAIDDELVGAGFGPPRIYGMDGPAPEAQELLSDAEPALIEQWADVAIALSADRSGLAASNHLLAVTTVT